MQPVILESLPQHIYVFAVILGVLTLAFLAFFIIPSFVVSSRLSKVTKKLRKLEGKPNANLDELFRETGILEHLWREYSHTLHEQVEPNPDGGEPRVRWRSTVPAEALFRPEIIVDTPLRIEFFRHLPGIFTGVGIIGTFFGLLMGLRAFQVSENPVIVRDSLNSLLHGVWEAFLVSVVAIALAMVLTLVEKLLIARLYAKVERLVQTLDGLFEAGAGEEYLARLVKASESSSVLNHALQDTLVAELRQLSAQQIAAANAASTALGDRIALGIEGSLKAPMTEMAAAIRGLRTDEWVAVQGLLTDVLGSFSRQIHEMFGGQISGINGMQRQTIEALQAAALQLERMGQAIESAGLRGASAMAERLGEALSGADARQRVMNDNMAEFVEQIRLAAARMQGETQGRLQVTLDELSTRMSAVIEALSTQVQSATDTSRKHHDALAGQTSRMVGEVGGQVGAIIDGVNRAVGEMKAAVDTMQRTTGDAYTKLNTGADRVAAAAADFAKAGQSVTGTLDKSEAVAGQLSHAAGSVAGVSSGLAAMVADYQGARDALGELVRSLQSAVDHAGKERYMTDDVLGRIEGATARLVEAQHTADGYLARVSDVIGEAHGTFNQGIRKTLEEVNKDFHRQLSDSVKLLRVGIQELQATLETVTSRR